MLFHLSGQWQLLRLMLRLNWDPVDSWLRGWPWVQLQVLIQGRAPAALLLLPDNTYKAFLAAKQTTNYIRKQDKRNYFSVSQTELCAGTQRWWWAEAFPVAQLSAVHTAVCREHSCLHGIQLSLWHAAVSMVHRHLQAASHGTQLSVWHTAVSGCTCGWGWTSGSELF